MLVHNVITLTMNPAVDLSVEVDKILPLHKLRCSSPRRDPGGGGVNVARVMRRLGADVTAALPLGGATGAILESMLRAEHIRYIQIPIEGETREDLTVMEACSGRQYRFVMPGPELSKSELVGCLEMLRADAPGQEFIVASGSLPPGAQPDFYADVARRAKSDGQKVILDTSGLALRAALREGVWLVKPNLRELTDLSGKSLPDETAWIAAAREIVARDGAQIVALSLAERGARMITRGRMWAAHAPPITPVSTVGAGDSFVGGLAWSLARDGDLPGALRYAVAAGTAALLSHGTELCHAETVRALLPKVAVEEI